MNKIQYGGSKFGIRQHVLRQVLLLFCVALAFWIFRDKIPELDFHRIRVLVAEVGAGQWAVAAIATCISFWAIGRYDAVIHGVLGTKVARVSASQSGIAAIAISQFAGFGVLSGALVRWRLLPNLSLFQAGRVSIAVSASFLAGWLVLTSLCALLYAPNLPLAVPLASSVIMAALGLVVLSVLQPRILPRLPSVRTMAIIVGLVAIDTFFAGLALWSLLPTGLDVSIGLFFTAFLIASGCGLIAGTPGGIGPFEFALLALLPQVPSEPILATALAFRLIYHVVPACLAALFLLRGPTRALQQDQQSLQRVNSGCILPAPMETAIWQARHAEANLVRQRSLQLLCHDGTPLAMAAITGQSLTVVRDPFSGKNRNCEFLSLVTRSATRCFVDPFLYKISARMAATARKQGWVVFPIAQEGWINPIEFDECGSAKRQLRRQLRKAQACGVIVEHRTRDLPLEDMGKIAHEWANARGAERGFSMGRYDEDFVHTQRVFLAWHADQLVAFLTMNEVENEWTLDLMRYGSAVPDGTMHMLLCHAIKTAAKTGCGRVSLAAINLNGKTEHRAIAALRRRLDLATGATGLRQFKSAFAPNWEPLYAAAPNRLVLFIGLWEVLRRIKSPRP